MSDVAEFLARVVAELDAARIPHMLAGSVAAGAHSAPRATQDLDIVIEPSADSIGLLVAGLQAANMYVSEESARDALAARDQFNAIDLASSWKVDLIVRKDRPFSVTEFGRRQLMRLLGVDVAIASPEDCVLSKLEWAAASESARQIEDVERLIATRRDDLDLDYLRMWATELGVIDSLNRSLSRIDGDA